MPWASGGAFRLGDMAILLARGLAIGAKCLTSQTLTQRSIRLVTGGPTMTRAPDNNVIEMPWTWERYMRLAARGYYSRAVETELTIASLRASGDEEGAVSRMRRSS